jgi:hypothetical protein
MDMIKICTHKWHFYDDLGGKVIEGTTASPEVVKEDVGDGELA